MNKKYCIFNEKKACNKCGECTICDIDRSKKCNNCGKCLELDGYDMKAVKIDTILDEEELKDYPVGEPEMEDCNQTDCFSGEEVEFIDDIDGLSEILDNREEFKGIIHEEYPGLIKIIKKSK